MAVLNIVTDIALILLPIPILWKLRLSITKSVILDSIELLLLTGRLCQENTAGSRF